MTKEPKPSTAQQCLAHVGVYRRSGLWRIPVVICAPNGGLPSLVLAVVLSLLLGWALTWASYAVLNRWVLPDADIAARATRVMDKLPVAISPDIKAIFDHHDPRGRVAVFYSHRAADAWTPSSASPLPPPESIIARFGVFYDARGGSVGGAAGDVAGIGGSNESDETTGTVPEVEAGSDVESTQALAGTGSSGTRSQRARGRSERLYAVLEAGAGSSAGFTAASGQDIDFFRRSSVGLPLAFHFTYIISTRTSEHAFERVSAAFFEDLSDRTTGSTYTKEVGEVIHRAISDSVSAHLSGISAEVNWHRRLNGPIQAATFVVFWALVLQLVCRLALNYFFDLQVRRHKNLDCLWKTNDVLKGLETRHAKVLDAKLKSIKSPDTNKFDAAQKRKEAIHHARQTFAKDAKEHIRTIRKATESALDTSSSASCLSGTRGVRRGRAHQRSVYLDLLETGARAYEAGWNYAIVPDFVDKRANEILTNLASSQNIIRFLLWGIPTIGFVGTVVGIGDSLLETVNVDSVNKGVAAIAKSTVSGNIGVSFDTTLLALVLCIPGMFGFHLVSQVEEQVVSRAARDATNQFMTKLPVTVAPLVDQGAVQGSGAAAASASSQLESGEGKAKGRAAVIIALTIGFVGACAVAAYYFRDTLFGV